ncbi:DUF1173 family protein [Acerihabitans sp. TG2]|uniref:DUF1173 family protein n=1 Tax=Acerihabitans sp. TG2 TaxID=3096008 RepID=UPI002B23A6E1|nr:DUF1173 family protein [Acerihabitans sp. TG2]MEA9392642.1 DUF1173 family protein [Acerihabitans sp. TG2]
MPTHYSIHITRGETTKLYTPEFQNEVKYAAGWKATLQKAHQHGIVQCKCPGQGERRLVVRYYEKTDSYSLARWPGAGPEHARDCKWWSMISETSGISGYQDGVVKEKADGTLVIRLAVGMKQQTPRQNPDENDASSPPVNPGKRRQSTMSPLGLMHLLWTGSQLNYWYPRMQGKRHISLLNRLLLAQANDISVGRVCLADALLLPAEDDTQASRANEEKVKLAIRNRSRLVAIAPLAKYTPEREQGLGRLVITHFFGYPLMLLDKDIWQDTLRRFPHAVSAWHRGGKIVACAQIDVPELLNGTSGAAKAQVLKVGVMQVSDRWIPLDSAYEEILEAKLAKEGRAYSKPLRFEIGEDVTLPDFCLLDTTSGKPFPMEVFGMDTADYQVRKQEKMEWYDEEYGPNGWWYWNVSAMSDDKSLPLLPIKKDK